MRPLLLAVALAGVPAGLAGQRSPGEIRNAVSAIYGPIPLPVVVEFLGALAAAGVVVR